jgi:hypothetical protein
MTVHVHGMNATCFSGEWSECPHLVLAGKTHQSRSLVMAEVRVSLQHRRYAICHSGRPPKNHAWR